MLLVFAFSCVVGGISLEAHLWWVSGLLLFHSLECHTSGPYGEIFHLTPPWLQDSFSFVLGVVVFAVYVLSVLVLFHSGSSSVSSISFLIQASSLVSVYVFYSSSLVLFYILFELSVIPMILLVVGWGYQPERLSAGKYLFFYTISGSLPLMAAIVLMHWGGVGSFYMVLAVVGGAPAGPLGVAVVVASGLAFMIKLPLFLVHLWLPKAHVEAPLVGSMILAAVVLKLGGCGLVRILPSLEAPLLKFTSVSVGALSLILVGGICTQLVDMKMVIAYSSVAHMGMGVVAILAYSSLSNAVALLVFLTHGVSSSFMFLNAFILYRRSGARSSLLNKNIMSWSPMFSFMWFMSCMGMLGAPPAVNILPEILGYMVIVEAFRPLAMVLVLAALIAGGYALVLFITVFHTKALGRSNSMAPLSGSEAANGMAHCLWLFFLILIAPWVVG